MFDKEDIWFHDLKDKVITNNPLRYIIPIDNKFKVLSIGMSDDYDIALKNGSNMIRVGHGYDSHRFKDGDFILLGGVKIPSKKYSSEQNR